MRIPSVGEYIIAVLLACYLLVCFSPLRLEYDSVQYFSVKDCLEDACPTGFVLANDPHPYGYPLLLLGLSRLGLLHASLMALINLLFLVGALYFTVRLFVPVASRRRGIRLPDAMGLSRRKLEVAVILVLLSYPIIKFFSYALSEMMYLFFSCGCLYFFKMGQDGKIRQRRVSAMVLALLFAGLAILTRTAGIILLPAMLAGLCWQYSWMLRRRDRGLSKGMVALIVMGLLVVGLLAVAGLYFLNHPGLYVSSVRISEKGWWFRLQEHLKEWGQLLWNVPVSKIPGLPLRMTNLLLVLSGILLVAVMVFCLIRKRRRIPVVVCVYMILYCLLIFCWPYFDVRFWIPVIAFLIILVFYTFRRPVVLVYYVITGLIAIGYSAYTSFSKSALARTQAGGLYRNEYEIFFFNRDEHDSVKKADPYVLHILESTK